MEMTDLVNILMNSMTGITAASSVAGALMGSRRRIGAGKGLLIGLVLPVVGLGIVATSRKTERNKGKEPDEKDCTIRENARKNAREHYNGNSEIRPVRQPEGRLQMEKPSCSKEQKRKLV